MDKKEAEQEALRRAKDAQNAAGKNVGMSGRDLVCSFSYVDLLLICFLSSNIILNGSWMKKMMGRIGIWINIDDSRKRRILRLKTRESRSSAFEKGFTKETPKVVVAGYNILQSVTCMYMRVQLVLVIAPVVSKVESRCLRWGCCSRLSRKSSISLSDLCKILEAFKCVCT